jgi:hypothetical protein
MIITLICLIGIAALAIEMAYHSELSHEIKSIFFMTEDYLQKVGVLSTVRFWTRFLPKYLWIFLPILLLFFIIFYKIIQAVNCPWCCGFWLSLTYLLLTGHNLITAIPMTGITLISVYIIQILDKHSQCS